MLSWEIYRDSLCSEPMRELWSQQSTIAHWLVVEQTLAKCQAKQGLIDPLVAEHLSAISVEQLDVAELSQQMALVGRPIVGLVAQLRQHLDAEQAPFVHYLSTTQDIMDTGSMLQMRQGLVQVEAQLATLLEQLQRHAQQQATTQYLGRTNGQYALPMALTTKLAVWQAELHRRREALREAAARGLLVQVGGPLGDLSRYPEGSGQAVKRAMATALGLGCVEPHWQNARDGVADILSALGALAASLCKIAHNANLLASSDIGEFSEGYTPGRGASSSMSHKRNQRASEFAEALARLARQRAEQIGELTLQQHERSGGAMIGEWLVVPEVFLLLSGALMWAEKLFAELQINNEVMQQRLATHAVNN